MRRGSGKLRAEALVERLAGGDRRSLGGAGDVVRAVERAPDLLPHLVQALEAPDERVRMRAADALEKVTRARAEWLAPYKRRLLRLAATTTQQELRWHLAQMVTRLPLTPAERRAVIPVLEDYLADASAIVRTSALHALADVAGSDAKKGPEVRRLLARAASEGTPAMRARARMLLARGSQEPGS